MTAKATPGRFRGFALVRDKDGKPKIDNYSTLPVEIFNMLSEDEKLEAIKNGFNAHNHNS